MATAEQTGLSLSDWVGIGGVVLTSLGIPLALIGAHFHSAVRNADARAKLIERLSTTGARDAYHERLARLLTWLDQRIGPPPFARPEAHERCSWGLSSLLVCIAISFAYSSASWLAGWVAGAPGGLGQVTLIELGETPEWLPAWAPEWLPRVVVALLLVTIGMCLRRFGRAVVGWTENVHLRLHRRSDQRWRCVAAFATAQVYQAVLTALSVVTAISTAVVVFQLVAGAVSGSVALALMGAFIVVVTAETGGAGYGTIFAGGIGAAGAFVVGGIGETSLIALLFWLALPWINGLLDWTSLSVSRWFGRAIVAERDSPRSLVWAFGLAFADLLAAVIFAFGIAWLLAFGVEAASLGSDLSLEFEAYVVEAAEAPWTTGFWATFMVLSTLFPTAVHFVLALGAVLMAWSGNPLRAWAASKLASSNEADWLGPQLYFTFGWLVPTLVVPAALIWLIATLVGLFEPLPDALRDTALHGIATAQAWLR